MGKIWLRGNMQYTYPTQCLCLTWMKQAVGIQKSWVKSGNYILPNLGSLLAPLYCFCMWNSYYSVKFILLNFSVMFRSYIWMMQDSNRNPISIKKMYMEVDQNGIVSGCILFHEYIHIKIELSGLMKISSQAKAKTRIN